MQEGQASPDAPVHVEYDIKITPRLVWAIVAPHVREKFMEQLKALLPVSVFLFVFQLLVVRQGVTSALAITAGLLAVIMGLMFFIEGIRLGVMPLGENIGATLPAKAGMAVVMPSRSRSARSPPSPSRRWRR